MVSTHLKNISQIGSFPQVGVKRKHIWNHHLELLEVGNERFPLLQSHGSCEILRLLEWLVGGWTNPSEKICSSNWIISPRIGMKKKYTGNHENHHLYRLLRICFCCCCCFHVLLEAAITALNICQHNFSSCGLLWGSQAWHNAVTCTVNIQVCRSNLQEWNFGGNVTRLTSFQTRGWKRYRHKSHGFKSGVLPHLQSYKLLYR